MTDARAEAPPILFPVQLVDVRCATVHGEHEQKPADALTEEAAVRLGITPLDEARRAFRVRLDVQVNAPSPADDQYAELLVVVQGGFASEADISDELYASYVEFTPVALLWPYARAYLAQVAAMLGIAIPPLPSLDVLGLGRSAEPDAEAHPTTG